MGGTDPNKYTLETRHAIFYLKATVSTNTAEVEWTHQHQWEWVHSSVNTNKSGNGSKVGPYLIGCVLVQT